MSIEKVRSFLAQYGGADRILEFPVSSATVELAAQALQIEPCRIAKTLAFGVHDTPILIVTAGDAKVDNAKYKARFGVKAKMLSHEDAAARIGHAVGGVCPFAVNEGVQVYLDVGSSNSAIELAISELERFSGFLGWVDVCKTWQAGE